MLKRKAESGRWNKGSWVAITMEITCSSYSPFPIPHSPLAPQQSFNSFFEPALSLLQRLNPFACLPLRFQERGEQNLRGQHITPGFALLARQPGGV